MIAVFAGGGELPLSLYQVFETQNEPYVVVKCSANTLPPPDHVSCLNLQWGKVSSTLDFLHHHKVTHIVLAGAVSRPEKLSDLKLDWRGLQWLNALRPEWGKGDDSLLKGVMNLFEKEGFVVCSPGDFLLLPQKMESLACPSSDHLASINLGREVLKTLSPYDVGQALVVVGSRILGIEGPEGTDALLRRCAVYLGDSDGILVKMAKIGQSHKVDLPTIGVQTIELLDELGYKGVAFEQQTSHVVNPDEVVKAANKKNIFILAL